MRRVVDGLNGFVVYISVRQKDDDGLWWNQILWTLHKIPCWDSLCESKSTISSRMYIQREAIESEASLEFYFIFLFVLGRNVTTDTQKKNTIEKFCFSTLA